MGRRADSSKSSSFIALASPEDWLVGGGEMGKLIRSMDWSKSPLGPIESWPQSLRTTVGLCLASNFPIALVLGPNHIQLYNDGYLPICGAKHPVSMGQFFAICWAAPWPVIGDAFDRAVAGETSFLEDQRMFLDRNGYLEETFFPFSFSPIRDETGAVGGLFHPVTETTSRMLSERRTRGLRDLAGSSGKAQTMEDACTLAAQTLAAYEFDLPFVLFYLFDDAAREARLAAYCGIQSGTQASPEKITLDPAAPASAWPLARLARSAQPVHCKDLARWFGQFNAGPYPEPVKEALVPHSTTPIAPFTICSSLTSPPPSPTLALTRRNASALKPSPKSTAPRPPSSPMSATNFVLHSPSCSARSKTNSPSTPHLSPPIAASASAPRTATASASSSSSTHSSTSPASKPAASRPPTSPPTSPSTPLSSPASFVPPSKKPASLSLSTARLSPKGSTSIATCGRKSS